MYRHTSSICKIASVYVFIEGSNEKVSIPEIASFWDKKFIVSRFQYHSRRHPPSHGIRIVLSDIEGGIRNIS